MKKLQLRPDSEIDPYQGDVERIIQICLDRNFDIDYATAKRAWEMFSESSAAGWLMLYQDDELVYLSISSYLVEEK